VRSQQTSRKSSTNCSRNCNGRSLFLSSSTDMDSASITNRRQLMTTLTGARRHDTARRSFSGPSNSGRPRCFCSRNSQGDRRADDGRRIRAHWSWSVVSIFHWRPRARLSRSGTRSSFAVFGALALAATMIGAIFAASLRDRREPSGAGDSPRLEHVDCVDEKKRLIRLPGVFGCATMVV